MFNHVMVGSNDIVRARRFYDAVLGVLGAGEPFVNQAPTGHTRLFYRHDGGTFCVSAPVNGEPGRAGHGGRILIGDGNYPSAAQRQASAGNGATIGSKCASAEQVSAFHDTAVAQGGVSIEDPPGLREGKLGAMYLAYVRDPDGNKLCAIYRPKPA